MKVLGIPVKDMSLGSTRTRYYYMLNNLPEGWEYERYRPFATGDVLYIQKTETREVWSAIKDCKQRDIPIVYERDDFCKPWNEEHTKVMDAADAITIITRGLLESVKHRTKTPMYFVPDGIDYDLKPEQKVPVRRDIRKIITYGRHANVEEAALYYKYINKKKYYICDRQIKEMRAARYIEWKLKNFIKKISKCDLVVIVHARNFRAKYKDPGRAMVAMALGIPVIVNDNIEMSRIAKDIGSDFWLVKKPDDMKKAMKLLEDYRTRVKQSQSMFEYAWKYYEPKKTSARLAEVFEKVIHEKSIS